MTDLHHPDASVQAQLANGAKVDVFMGWQLDPAHAGCSTAYYSGYRDESPGDGASAELVQTEVPHQLQIPIERARHVGAAAAGDGHGRGDHRGRAGRPWSNTG